MKKNLIILAVCLTVFAGTLAGCGKKNNNEKPEGSITFDSSIEDKYGNEIAPVDESVKAKAEKTPDSSKEEEIKVPEGLQGIISGNTYYNSYFNVGIIFDNRWEVTQGDDFLSWFVNFDPIVYTDCYALASQVGAVISNIAFGKAPDIERELNQTIKMFENDGYTVEKGEIVDIHLEKETLPALWVIATKEGEIDMHMIITFKTEGDYNIRISFSSTNDEELFREVEGLYSE